MSKTWHEHDITLDTLAAHLSDSGVASTDHDDRRILLHTGNGIAYTIALDTDKHFVRFASWLPLDKTQSLDRKRDFALRLSEDVFLPTFYIDGDGDLSVSYVLPYRFGLIAGQFVALVNRFASLLDYLVASQNQEDLIRFDEDDPDVAPETPLDHPRLLN